MKKMGRGYRWGLTAIVGAGATGGEVDHHRLLAAVKPDEVAALSLGGSVVAAGEIAFRPLDLVDRRTGIGEARGTEGGSDRLLDGDDGQSFKRQHERISV